MFGSIGVIEIMVLAAVALVIMGPEKFPDFARTVARMVRDVRGYVSDAQRDLEREIRPIKKEMDELSKVDPETYIDRLAESAFKDSTTEDEEQQEYNPEPEGPTVDETFQYGSYGDPAVDASSPSESQAGVTQPSTTDSDTSGSEPESGGETSDEDRPKSSDEYAD